MATLMPTATNTPITPTATGLPDLSFGGIVPIQLGGACEKRWGTSVTVRNSTSIDITGSFIVRLNNTQDRTINGIPANQTTTVQFNGYAVTNAVTIDPMDVIAESNENNNSLTISAAPTPTSAAPAMTCTPAFPPSPTPTNTVPGLTDLIVSSITTGPVGATCFNQWGTIVTVKNNGTLTVNFPFVVRLNNVQDRTVNSLAAGQSATLQYFGLTSPATATVDALNQIIEYNENNNSLTATVPVPPPALQPTCTPTGGFPTPATLTVTPTATPTRTNTPSTMTPTTPAPPSTLKVQYKAGDTITGDNQFKPYFNIVNTGSTAVALSSLKIRYYLTKESGGDLVFNCDWAQLGCANIAGTFVAISPAKTNADTYLEIGFTTAAGSIAAGGSSGEIQTRNNKSDWTNFNESNDYSFDATKTSFADWSRVALYQNGTLVWGVAP
jgi:hypothetical protein